VKAGAVACIGDADSVMGFKALGVEAIVPSGADDAVRSFRNLVAGGASVIIVVEDYLDWLAAEIEQTARMPIPAVVVLPGLGGTKGRGGETIRKQITRAVGVDLMAEDR
jgi:V/A-type H+-transporting ATPase subunit F